MTHVYTCAIGVAGQPGSISPGGVAVRAQQASALHATALHVSQESLWHCQRCSLVDSQRVWHIVMLFEGNPIALIQSSESATLLHHCDIQDQNAEIKSCNSPGCDAQCGQT